MFSHVFQNLSALRIIRFSFALCIGLAIYPVSEGLAQIHCQDYWTPEYKCAMGCGPCGDSAPAQQQRPVYNGPSADQIAAQQRLQIATRQLAAANAAAQRAEEEQVKREAAAQAAAKKAAHNQQAARQLQQDRKALSELHGLPQDSDASVATGTFREKVAKPNLAPRNSIVGPRAVTASDQAISAAEAGENSGQNFDSGGAKPAQSLDFSTSRKISDRATRVNNDPRMKSAMKQLGNLQAKRSQVDTELKQLIKERDVEKDRKKSAELTKKVDQKNNEYQATLKAVSEGEQMVKKTQLKIETEVEGSPDAQAATSAAGKN